MAYTWTDGELITAEKLNQTGGSSGLVVNVATETQGSATIYTMDKTAREIVACFESGVLPMQHIVKQGLGNFEAHIYSIFSRYEIFNDGAVGFNIYDPNGMEVYFLADSLGDYPSYTVENG